MSAPPLLSDDEVDAALVSSSWHREGSEIVSVRECGSFAAALGYVVSIGALAQAADHHPDMTISWETVRVVVSTHESGGVTSRDIDLARQVDELVGINR